MAPTHMDPALERQLGALIEGDLDAIETYYAAIGRLVDPTDRVQFGRFVEDHRRHVAELTDLLVELGGAPPAPDFKQWLTRSLTKGRVAFLSVTGDLGVLEAMKDHEEGAVRAYEVATRLEELPEEARALVARYLADEARHHAWIEQRLGREERHGRHV